MLDSNPDTPARTTLVVQRSNAVLKHGPTLRDIQLAGSRVNEFVYKEKL